MKKIFIPIILSAFMLSACGSLEDDKQNAVEDAIIKEETLQTQIANKIYDITMQNVNEILNPIVEFAKENLSIEMTKQQIEDLRNIIIEDLKNTKIEFLNDGASFGIQINTNTFRGTQAFIEEKIENGKNNSKEFNLLINDIINKFKIQGIEEILNIKLNGEDININKEQIQEKLAQDIFNFCTEILSIPYIYKNAQ